MHAPASPYYAWIKLYYADVMVKIELVKLEPCDCAWTVFGEGVPNDYICVRVCEFPDGLLTSHFVANWGWGTIGGARIHQGKLDHNTNKWHMKCDGWPQPAQELLLAVLTDMALIAS